MTTLYKMTSRDMCTFGKCKWKLGETKKIPRELRYNPILCTARVFHAFVHPLQALIYRYRYTLFAHPRLFLAKGNIVKERYNKVAVQQLTLIKELKVPRTTKFQLVKILVETDRPRIMYKDAKHWSRADLLSVLEDRAVRNGRARRMAMYKAYDKICGKPKAK